MVVGTIVPDRPYLEPHGNYNPRFGGNFTDAKMQFTLAHPGEFSRELGSDFDKAIHVLNVLQHKGGQSKTHLHLLTDHLGRKAIRFSLPLFSVRVCSVFSPH
jgi:hypothetical protein